MTPLPPGRYSTTSVWPVFSLTFLSTMRCSVSELAPGVNGMTMVIGREESSSAAAPPTPAPVTDKTAARAANARNIYLSPTVFAPQGSPNQLSLGIVKAARFPPRRADTPEKRPTRRIACRKAFLRAFVDFIFQVRGARQLRLALAPPASRAVLYSGSRCHRSAPPLSGRARELSGAHDTTSAQRPTGQSRELHVRVE